MGKAEQLAAQIRGLPPGDFASMIETLAGEKDPQMTSGLPLYGSGVRERAPINPGAAVAQNEQLSNWTPPSQGDAWSPPVQVPGGMRALGKAVLFDREDVKISVGTVGDDFIRNIVRVLGELRAGFAVVRPSAFVEVDLLA